MNESSELQESAHHEAAHAVVHFYFGHELESITIEPDGRGRCTLSDDWRREIDIARVQRLVENEFLLEQLISDAAGKVCEDRLRGTTEQNWRARRSGRDHERASATALRLSGGDEQAALHLLKWAECMSRAMVEQHWLKVEKLANAITKKQRFTGNGKFSRAEIRAVLLGSSGRNGSNGER